MPNTEFITFNLPGIWEQSSPNLYVKKYGHGENFIEAETDGFTVRFKAKKEVTPGGLIKAVSQVGETLAVNQADAEAVANAIQSLEKTLNDELHHITAST